MRMIDGDALDQAVKKALCWNDVTEEEIVVRRLIKNAPTIDPERHGYWIQHYAAGPLKSECSACHTTFNTRIEYGPTTMYCPACRAKMDLEVPHEQ